MVVNNLDVGGLEKVVISLLQHLDRTSFELSLICVNGPGKLFSEVDLPAEATLVLDKSGARTFGIVRFDPVLLARIRTFLERRHVDVIHAHNAAPLIYAGFASRLGGRRPTLVYSEHNQIYSASPVARLKFSAYVRLADVVVAVSHDLRRTLLRNAHLTCPVRVIHNGIDGARYRFSSESTVRLDLGVAPDDFLVGTGVVLSKQKGIPYLLEAARRVLAEDTKARFVIAGDGPMRHELEQMAARLRLGDGVRFLGYRSDIPQFISALDLYVLPSLWEGLPLALLEAMAVGKPIVATQVGGNAEVVEDGVNGYVVPARDPVALARAILRVRRDPAFAEQVRDVNVHKFEVQFSVGAMVKAHERLFREVAHPSRRR
jgi:glycosyltransferase involved in cell wall biosynthesis